MKFKSYKCVIIGKIYEIHILIDEMGFFKIFRDTFWPKIKPGSRELNPNPHVIKNDRILAA